MPNQDPCQSQRDAVSNIEDLLASLATEAADPNTGPQLRSFIAGETRVLAGTISRARGDLARCIGQHSPRPPYLPIQVFLQDCDFQIEVQMPTGSGTVPPANAEQVAASIREQAASRVPGSDPEVVIFDLADRSTAPDAAIRQSSVYGCSETICRQGHLTNGGYILPTHGCCPKNPSP